MSLRRYVDLSNTLDIWISFVLNNIAVPSRKDGFNYGMQVSKKSFFRKN